MRLKPFLLFGFLFAIMVSTVSARPGMVACAIASSDSSVSAGHQQLLLQAKARIQDHFGPMQAEPIVVFFDDTDAFWPLKLNSYGSTSFLGPKICVMVGPEGQNVDVTAHELMHAELAQRVGSWARMTQIPTWFDEGLAMQVDYRSHYDLPDEETQQSLQFVTELDSGSDFFVADNQLLTQHYAAAKAWVADWVAERGQENVFAELTRLSSGGSFEELVLP